MSRLWSSSNSLNAKLSLISLLSFKNSSAEATRFLIPACYGHYWVLDTETGAFSYLKSAHILMLSFKFILPMTGDFL